MYLHCLFVVIVSFEGQMFFAIFMYYHYPVFLMSHDVLYDDYTMVVALYCCQVKVSRLWS
jgi:hypothetical protein